MRLFAAVMADEATRGAGVTAQACLRARLDGPRLTWVAPPALHVTLCFLGEVAPEVGVAVQQALAGPLRTPAFDVRWAGLGRFPASGPPRVVWLGCERGADGWRALHGEVSARLRALVPLGAEPFHPHLTLARVKAPGPRRTPWADALARCGPAPVESRVTQVHLVQSRLGAGGPSYTALTGIALA
jgi:2'-5' RNA ligase